MSLRERSVIESMGDGSARIQLCSHSGAIKGYAIIDIADISWVSQHRWHLNNKGYAARGWRVRLADGKRKTGTILLHRELLGLTPGDGMEGDHINRDRLDDRRINLRALPESRAPQMQNQSSNKGSSSQYRGVSWHKRQKKWVAYVQVDGKLKHLGSFSDEIAAANVARDARKRWMPYSFEGDTTKDFGPAPVGDPRSKNQSEEAA